MKYQAQKFFELENFPWDGLFTNKGPAWDVLPNINTYIDMELKKIGKTSVFLGTNSIMQDTARVQGQALIGKNCVIGHGVLLRDGVIIGDNVTIGHGAEVKHSIVLNNTCVAHLNYIGDSIIGSDVNISGGAVLANFRFDKKTIRVSDGDSFIETGLQKFGSVVGDGSIIGVNAALNPGTVLGKNSIIYPLVSVKGSYPDGTIIKKTY